MRWGLSIEVVKNQYAEIGQQNPFFNLVLQEAGK
jgi:hypothetical protein